MSDDKPKPIVPPTRGSGGPHPAEVTEHLSLAYQLCNRLIEAAEHRGDQMGADAWLVARNAIETAEKSIATARTKQTWRTFHGERVDQRRPHGCTCLGVCRCGITCEHGTRGCTGRGEKHACI